VAALTLYRTDPERNLRRFYLLDVQPDLFGRWSLVREWGRMGQPGDVLVRPYPTEGAASAALERQRSIKERRGYRPLVKQRRATTDEPEK
jgi:predicted DNA-binding WGR domain protein